MAAKTNKGSYGCRDFRRMSVGNENKIYIPELASSVAELAGLTKKQAEDAIKWTAQLIISEVAAGKEIHINKLGKFCAKDRAARECRNLQTGLPVHVPAKRVLAFKPSASVKEL